VLVRDRWLGAIDATNPLRMTLRQLDLFTANTMLVHNPFQRLPHELEAQIISLLDVPALKALAATYQVANRAEKPWVYVRMKARDKKEGLPEVSEWLKPHLDRLGIELNVVVRVGKTRKGLNNCSAIELRIYGSEFRRAMRPVVQQLNALPPLSALQLAVSYCDLLKDYRDNTHYHRDKTERKSVQYDLAGVFEPIEALPAMQAVQTISDSYGVFYRLLGKQRTLDKILQPVLERISDHPEEDADWSARMEALAALLHQIAEEIRCADRAGNFSLEVTITFPVTKAILALLKELGESKAPVDASKVHILIGELVRTWTQGYMRNWPAGDARRNLQQPILSTGLITEAQFEKIFRLATSHAHESISFKDIRKENAACLRAKKSEAKSRRHSQKSAPASDDKVALEKEAETSNRSAHSEQSTARPVRRRTLSGPSERPPENVAKNERPGDKEKCIVC
jgi:hypothetical protein